MRDMKQDFELISSSLTNIVTKMTEFSLTPKILSLTELNIICFFLLLSQTYPKRKRTLFQEKERLRIVSWNKLKLW